jgi:uncharacterized protein (TIGR03435 family)
MHTGWSGPNWTIDAAGQSLDKLALSLGGIILGRAVLDKTGIAGVFGFHLVFAHDENAPGSFPEGLPSPFQASDVPTAASLPSVLEQQLGLKLVTDRGPREYVVIDSAERPAMN